MNWKPPAFFAFMIMPYIALSQSIITIPDQFQEDKTWVEITSADPAPSQINLLYSDFEISRFEIITQGFWKKTIRAIAGNPEIKVFTDNSTPLMFKGSPDLYKLTASLAIPDLARMQVSITEEEFTDLHGIQIIPSKGNLTRDIDPDDIPYEYGREYETDAFFPGVAAELRKPHIIRDVRGQAVVIYPFRYNPVQKTLRVYTRLVVEVKVVGEDGENNLTVRRENVRTDRAFKGIYARNFINYAQYQNASRYIPLEEDGNMLIISHGPFMAYMQDFVDWKNVSGIHTEIVDVSSIGSTSADIKAFVANYYNNNGLTFLLLVGDAAQVPPSSTSAGVSDNDYGYIVGNDHYPDIFTGRFSAQTSAHVQTQVKRTLDYEKEPVSVLGSFERAMCIASNLGPGDDDEYDWAHQRNIRNDYMGFSYTYGAELYDGSQGGEDATGNPTSTMVANQINTGIGIITYTGHGSTTFWNTSGFNNTGINNLANNDMLPFIISVACVNGNFMTTTCFAEAWLRATHNGEPSGAIATIMSTINQSWNPPMCAQDEMVDILVESYPANIRRTFGGICMNGCMNMNDVYGSAGDAMTDTWTIFGDPSLMVRTATPVTMNASHMEDLPVGSSHLTVYCDQEGARVAISDDYQLLATGIINNGSVDVNFDPIYTEDMLTIAITAFNCIPVIDTLIITDADMAYVSCTAFHQDLEGVAPGEQDAEVLGVKIVASGSLNPFNLQSLIFNMDGTTYAPDVSGPSVYYTGNTASFNTSALFGVATPGSFTVTGNQALNGGYNYFWLAYNLSASSALGNFIDGECTGLVISDSNSVTRVPTVTDPSGEREIEVMELLSVNTSQPHNQTVFPGDQAVDIICIEMVTSGTPLPLQVNSLRIFTEGTTDLGDISNIKVYYTSDNVFATDALFGSVSPDDSLVINGIRDLGEGTNYFWVAYDLNSQAVPGNELDAECHEIVIEGSRSVLVPDITDPPGYRMVELDYCIPSYYYGTGYGDFISLVGLASMNKSSSASSSPYYTFYQDVTTCLVTDSNYNLIVSPGTCGSGNKIAAWIDFNHDGIFVAAEKLGEITAPTMPATETITFHVPKTAFTGAVRMRVREVYSTTNIDPCKKYNYGETEDYQVHIMPPGYWLGFSSEWNNSSNWSDGVVPGSYSRVTIPEIMMGNQYPAQFTGNNPVIYRLDMEDGSNLHIPDGVTITVGNGK